MRSFHLSAACTALLGLATAGPLSAQCDEFVLPEPYEPGSLQLGSAVDIGGNLLMITQPANEPGGTQAANGWRRVPGGWVGAFAFQGLGAGAETGASVSVSESGVVALGAPGDSNSSGGTGRVVILDWDGSSASFGATISPPTTLGYPVEEFGRSVSVDETGEWVVVGSPATFGDAGCAFLYRNVGGTWTFQQDVFLGTAPDRFGSSVAISEGKVIVGSPGYDGVNGADSGGVFFYDLDAGTGTLTSTSQTDGFLAGAALGSAVSMKRSFDGVWLSAAGAPSANGFGTDGGEVVFFDDGVVVGAFSQVTGNELGASVDVDAARTILAGRPGTDSVDVYRYNGATVDYLKTFVSVTPQPGERFGASVAIQNGYETAVGAPLFDEAFVDAGRVLTYEATTLQTVWVDEGFAKIGSWGTPSLQAVGEICGGNSFTLYLSGGRPNAQTGLFAGFSKALLPFKQGTLVPSPASLTLLMTDFSGDVTLPAAYPVGFDGIPLTFQFWIDDPTVLAGVSASNGLTGFPPTTTF